MAKNIDALHSLDFNDFRTPSMVKEKCWRNKAIDIGQRLQLPNFKMHFSIKGRLW